jgi:hypothetical protein
LLSGIKPHRALEHGEKPVPRIAHSRPDPIVHQALNIPQSNAQGKPPDIQTVTNVRWVSKFAKKSNR